MLNNKIHLKNVFEMPRRRKIEIKASELACFDTLVETLRTRPEFADFDPTSLHVWAYENYEPTIRNAARAIRHFDYWLAAHRNEMFLSSYSGNRLFCKKDLAEALGITRPTLDRWIANGWLEGCTARAFSNGERCYSADAVREALEKLNKTHKNSFVSEDGSYQKPSSFIHRNNHFTHCGQNGKQR